MIRHFIRGGFEKLRERMRPARNDDERREGELIDSLYAEIKGNKAAINLMVRLIAYYNTKIYRLRFFLDHLSFPADASQEVIPKHFNHPEEYEEEEEEETTDKVRLDDTK